MNERFWRVRASRFVVTWNNVEIKIRRSCRTALFKEKVDHSKPLESKREAVGYSNRMKGSRRL